MTCTKETVKSSGLNFWSGEAAGVPAPIVDIIAVQGLGAHPFYTWVKKAQTSQVDEPIRLRDKARFWKSSKKEQLQRNTSYDGLAECMWIRDLLVPEFKDARVATYSYESDWRDPKVTTDLRQCAEQFLNILYQHRQHKDERRRPLVLIGHSLGCLVIQQALVIAVLQQEFTDLRLSVAGIIFLGAPFQGSDVALFAKSLAQLSGRDIKLLELLERNSPSLYSLSRDFWGSHSDWDLVCFYEKIEAQYGPIKKQIVSSQSASILGKRMMFLTANHSGLNKFSGEGDENYEVVLPEIQRIVRNGPSIVAERFRRKVADATSNQNIHWMVPRSTNQLFVGRVKLLERIEKAIQHDNAFPASTQKRFVITGLGGQGKSEICLKVASQMREQFWGVFWVDVNKPSTAESNFIAIAKTLGHSVDNVAGALQVLVNTKQRWLLILDNADDRFFDYQVYLPSGTSGAVIMTSRVIECKKYSRDAFEALEGLGDDCKELLLRAAEMPQELWQSNDQQAQVVVRLLGSHTLALIQAGAYIARGHCRLDQYPQVYHGRRRRLLEYQPEQAQSRYCNVYATFEASANILEQSESEEAKDALCLLAILSMLGSSILPLQIFESAWKKCRKFSFPECLETADIDALTQSHITQIPNFMKIEGSKWDSFRLVEASSVLVSLSLVMRQDLDGLVSLSMHPLAHAWSRDRQDKNQQSVAWISTGCVLAFSRYDRHLWQTQERLLLPHILSYLEMKVSETFSFGSRAIITPILLTCGSALVEMRQDSRLECLLEELFVELGQSIGEPTAQTLPLYELQARSLGNIGKNKMAVTLLHQVVNIRETTLEENNPHRLASQHALGTAYSANGQVQEAVKLLEQVVKIKETILAEDHPGRLASQHALGNAYLANGQVQEALKLLEQIVKIRETILAEDHPHRLASQHALGTAYWANGQKKKAVALLKQVAKIKQVKFQEGHPSRLVSEEVLSYFLQNI